MSPDVLPCVVSVTVNTAGTGYINGDATSAIVTCVAPCTGTGAAGTCKVTSGQVQTITITDGGSGYTTSHPPKISCPGGNADLAAIVRIGSVKVIRSSIQKR